MRRTHANNFLNLKSLLLAALLIASTCSAQKGRPLYNSTQGSDTAILGVYVNSIHNIDFKQNEYAIDFWVWINSKIDTLDFINNLQMPNAKSFEKEYITSDFSQGVSYTLMRIKCVMRDNWKITNFPFDHQELRMSFENSGFDSTALVIVPDTLGEHYDKNFAINGWVIDHFDMQSGRREYKTAFGDYRVYKPNVVFSSLRVKIGIRRNAAGLFWKMFLGMYLAFLIAYICFYIHPDDIGSRFGISVGAIFAVIGNKYIIDGALPESGSFTLVDTLHGITLFAVFLVITATAISLRLIKQGKHKHSGRFDMIAANIILILYLISNIYFIIKASNGG